MGAVQQVLASLADAGGGAAGLPPDTFAGLTLWLDFTDSSNLFEDTGASNTVENGDAVLRLTNKADSTLWLANVSPTFISPGSAGSTDECSLGSNQSALESVSNKALSNYISASAYTACFLVRPLSIGVGTGSGRMLFRDSGGYARGNWNRAANPGPMYFSAYNFDINADEATIADESVIDDWSVITIQHTGGNIRARRNRGAWATAASGNTGLLTGTLYILGATYATPSVRMKHATMYNVALADADLEDLEDWMAAQAGLSL